MMMMMVMVMVNAGLHCMPILLVAHCASIPFSPPLTSIPCSALLCWPLDALRLLAEGMLESLVHVHFDPRFGLFRLGCRGAKYAVGIGETRSDVLAVSHVSSHFERCKWGPTSRENLSRGYASTALMVNELSSWTVEKPAETIVSSDFPERGTWSLQEMKREEVTH